TPPSGKGLLCRTMLRALAIAAALSTLAFASVVTGFSAARVKLVQTPVPSVSGGVAFAPGDLPGGPAMAAPFAVIARIHNQSDSQQTYTLRLNGEVLCHPTLAAGATRRVDCVSVAAWDGRPPRFVAGSTGASPWTLEYLELATHNGATQDYDLVIVPRGSRASVPLPRPTIAVAFFVLVALFLVPGALPDRFHLVAVHRAAA